MRPYTAAAVAVTIAAPGGASAPEAHASGERMEFSVSYLGLRVGKAHIAVGEPDGPTLPVFLESRTTGVVGIVKLRQQLASYLDRESGLPRHSALDAVEGGYRHVDTTRFDRDAGKAVVRVRGKHDNTYELDVPPGTLDFVGLVFRLRMLPLEPGSRHTFDVLAGRRLSRVVVEVTGRERVETHAGEFEALKVRVPAGMFGRISGDSPTFLWLSDDARRIVLRISADFSVGRATARLVSYAPGRPSG